MSGFLGTQSPTVAACATSAITASGAQTVDGVALVAGMLCLRNGDGALNDVYLVQAGAWVRLPGTSLTVFVTGGSANQGVYYGSSGDLFSKMTPARILPDAADVLVYYNGVCTLPLTTTGTLYQPLAGQFGEDAVGYPIANGSGGGRQYTAGTTVGEADTQSISAWGYVTSGTTRPNLQPWVVKMRSPTVFDPGGGPFSAGFGTIPAGGGLAIFAVMVTTDDTLIAQSGELDVGWHHVGQTYANGTLKLYTDGVLVDSVTTSGSGIPDWKDHGPWSFMGWFTHDPPDSPPITESDSRVTVVERTANYFAQIWATGRIA